MKQPEDESELRDQVMNLFKQEHLAYFKHWSGQFSKKGVADIYLTLPGGRACWIELKGPKGKPTNHQIEFMREHSEAGALCFFAYSVEAVIINLAAARVKCMQRIRRQFPGGLKP